jgi:hypothetical protein
VRKPGRRTNAEYVPSGPFQTWLNERVTYWERQFETSRYSNQNLSAVRMVCAEIGWGGTEAGVRRLYKYRHAVKETKTGGRGGPRLTLPAFQFPRDVVEDALHAASVDFYEVYPQYAHEQQGPPQPEAWCPNCQDHVLVVRETWLAGRRRELREKFVCVWCDWVMSEGHLNQEMEEAA